MKQNNQYLWVFAIVFLAFFTGCQQDYLQEGNTSQDIYQLMGETFERYERNLVTFEEFSAHLQGYEVFEYYAPKFENADPEAYISRISKNKILKLENDSITTYTLNVVTSDEDNNSFTNILFIEKDNMLRRYFLKYTPTESWKNAVLEGGVYSGFEGSITFVDDSGQGFSFLENYPINEYSSSFGGCLAVFYTENTPCCLNISCCPCTDGNGVNTLVIDIQCPGGGSSGDDPGDNPWNGLLPDNGGGSEGGGTGPGIIQQIPTEPIYEEDCNITPAALGQLFPNSALETIQTLTYYINEYGAAFGIDTKEKLTHFLAQVGAETGGLTTLNTSENLNYTTSNRLKEVFYVFNPNNPNSIDPTPYLNNPQGLANLVYCCRYGNGNVSSGDGWYYRGGGILQLTWKGNYTDYYNFLQNVNLGWSYTGPDDVRNTEMHAIFSGMWYFKVKVLDKTEIHSNTNADMVTKKVNPGATEGMKQIRRNYLNQAIQNINCQ